jgi:Asp-tRNA(Asn)/Glu-tRNA(Gln) amidotransferase A subunit family amidase
VGDEVCALPAIRLVRLLREREISAVELLERVLARADEVADNVNPFRRYRHSGPPEPPLGKAVHQLRVVASEDLGFAPVDDDVRRVFRRVVAALTRAGVEFVADTAGLSSSAATWATIACAEARWSEAAEYELRPDLLSSEVHEYLPFGEGIPTQAYVQAQFERERIHRAYADLFARTGADVLLTPTLGGEAFAHGRRYPEAIGGVPIEPPWLDWSGCLYDSNLAGLPACAVPAGLGDDRLPVSVQVVGERWRDHLVLAAAQTIESTLAAIAPSTGPARSERQET